MATRKADSGYDSGITTLTDGFAQVTETRIRALSVLPCNLTAAAQSVTLTDVPRSLKGISLS